MIYCPGCGKLVSEEDQTCNHCGEVTDWRARDSQWRRKVKTAAVIMAALFGPFTWLYTVRKDYWKFLTWMSALLGAVLVGHPVLLQLSVIAVWLWAILDTALKPFDWYKTYPYN